VIAAKLREFRSAPNFADYLLIAAVVAATTAVTIWWVGEDTRPPNWDEGAHLSRTLFYREHLLNFDVVTFLVTYAVYPPLTYWVAQPFYIVFGTTMTAAVASQSVFVAVLAISMYELGRELWSRRVGLLAMALAVTLPMVVSQFREFQLDPPLAAMTALSLLMLVLCREFSSRKYSLALGFALGLALLTKWTVFFAMVFPVALALLWAAKHYRETGDLARIKNFAMAVGLALFISLPWYLAHVNLWIRDIRRGSEYYGVREGDPEVLSFQSAHWYFSSIVNDQLYLLPFVLVCIGVAFCFVTKENLRRNLYPLLLVLGCYFFLTIVRNKEPRYITLAVPALTLLAVYWVDQLRGWWPRVAVGAIATYAVVAFLAISFGLPLIKSEQVIDARGGEIVIFAERGYRVGPPSSDRWMLEDIVKQIAASESGEERAIYDHGPGGDSVWFNNASFSYYGEIYGVDFIDRTRVNDAEFIVKHNRDASHDPPAGFRTVDSWTLPNDTLVTLMQRFENGSPAAPGASAR